MIEQKARIVSLEGDWDIARREELERLLKPVYDSPGSLWNRPSRPTTPWRRLRRTA